MLVKSYKSHRRTPDKVELPKDLSPSECCLCPKCNPERLREPKIHSDQALTPLAIADSSTSSSSSSLSSSLVSDSPLRRSSRSRYPSELMLQGIVSEADSSLCIGQESSRPSTSFVKADLSRLSSSSDRKTLYPLLYVDDDEDEEEDENVADIDELDEE